MSRAPRPAGRDFGLGEQRPGERFRLGAGDRDLEAVLAGVAGARGEAGDAADRRLAAGHEGELGELRGEPRHHRGGLRPLQCEQRALGQRLDQAAGREVGAQVRGVGLLAGGVDHQEQVVGAARHHQVVEDAAGVVGEEGVALLARSQADDVDRNQRLQRGRGVVAGQPELAHVRDVEQHRRLAALPVLGEDALRIRHRHRVAGERHHLRAELEVQRMQRRVQQRRGRGCRRIGGCHGGSGANCTPAPPRPPGIICPCCPLYLRDWRRRERHRLPLRWTRSKRVSLQRGTPAFASACQSLVPERSTRPEGPICAFGGSATEHSPGDGKFSSRSPARLG